MPPAVRLSDKAAVSADKHGCPACPHPGFGPAVNGSPNVFINKKPAIRLGDPGVHMACCGPNQWKTDKGSSTVYVNNKPLVRMGDKTKHCGGDGKMIMGSPNVFADDGGAGAGLLAKLLAALLEAGRALLEKWSAKQAKKAGKWAGKLAKGKGGKGKAGKGGKGKDGKNGKGGKGGKGGGGGGGGGGADGGGGAGGGIASLDPENQDLSSDVDGTDSTAGEGIIRIGLVRPTIKPGQKCEFVVECRSATTGKVKVKAVLVDADGKEIVTTKETSVDAALEARGSFVFENLDAGSDGAFETPEKAQKWIEDTLGHPAGSRRFKFLLRASHDTGDKDSPDATCDLDAVANEVVIHLFDESEGGADTDNEVTNRPTKKRVPGKTWASVKLEGHASPFRVQFVEGRGVIPDVVIPEDSAGEGQEDPRVLSIEFDNKKFQKYAWKAFVPDKDVQDG